MRSAVRHGWLEVDDADLNRAYALIDRAVAGGATFTNRTRWNQSLIIRAKLAGDPSFGAQRLTTRAFRRVLSQRLLSL